MKLNVSVYPKHDKRTVEGAEARKVLKEVLTGIGQMCLLPEPPFTGIVRKRALDRLREGGNIWSDIDANGRPRGTVISMPVTIHGIIKHDGSYEPLTEEGKKIGEELARDKSDENKTP